MAEMTMVTCDVCPPEDNTPAERMDFTVQGEAYQVDVCVEHAGNLMTALETVDLITRLARPRKEKQNRGPRRSKAEVAAVKAWSAENGRPLGTGRLPMAVVEAYNDAHPEAPVAMPQRGGRPAPS